MQTNPKQSEFVPIFLIFLTCLSKLKKKKSDKKQSRLYRIKLYKIDFLHLFEDCLNIYFC